MTRTKQALVKVWNNLESDYVKQKMVHDERDVRVCLQLYVCVRCGGLYVELYFSVPVLDAHTLMTQITTMYTDTYVHTYVRKRSSSGASSSTRRRTRGSRPPTTTTPTSSTSSAPGSTCVLLLLWFHPRLLTMAHPLCGPKPHSLHQPIPAPHYR